MSRELGQVADTYRLAVQRLTGWDGAAMEAYRGAAERYAATVRSASTHAASLSNALSSTGADVGTVRAMIRDTIAERVWELVTPALAAMLAGPATAGGSLGAFLAYAVAQSTRTAAENAQRAAELLDRLSTSAERVSELSRRIGSIADAVDRGLADVAAPALDVLSSGATAGVVEYGKQHTEARQEQG
jgi:methyl-accepting chemotaxis protein